MRISNSVSNGLYSLAVVFVILWAIGFLGYNFGGIIHILLGIALIAVLLNIIRSN
jgi:hypothetical protein